MASGEYAALLLVHTYHGIVVVACVMCVSVVDSVHAGTPGDTEFDAVVSSAMLS